VKVPEKETEGNNNNNNNSSSSSHKKAKTNSSIDVKTELKTCSFPAVVDVFGTSTELLSKVYGRRNKVSAQLLAFLLTALRFQDQHDRFPVTGAEADIAAMQSLSTQHRCSYDTAKFHPLLSSLACESSPVCAITGGMLTQEVMKAITAKSAPFKNVLLYNSKTGKALVKYVGPAEAKKVVKKQVVEDIILL
jgi:hypothetical protein